MKRRLSVCLFILVVLFALFAAAETDPKDFHCGEQGYTTRIPADASTTFQPGNGLRIWLDEPGYVPNVLIWRRTDDVEDPQTYIRETYTEHMKKTYGSRLVGTSLSEYVDMGGKRLLGAAYIYKGSSGATINQMHLLEVREDGQVEYDARYLNSERDMTLAALDAAVRYYQPDSGSSGETASEEVHCEEQGYTTRMPAGKTTTFQEGNGLRIWLDEPGYVPNVLIWRRTSRLSDPDTYLGTSYPAYMKEKYGDNLLSVTQQADVAVGGKHLRGTAYVYKGSSGATINQLHLVDIRHEPSQEDCEMNTFLRQAGIPFSVIATKADKISRGARLKYLAPICRALSVQPWQVIPFSSQDGTGRDAVLNLIETTCYAEEILDESADDSPK